jgi:hypothetical protein
MLKWLKNQSADQSKSLKNVLNTWQGQNGSMHQLLDIMLNYGEDMEIAEAIVTIWKALKKAPTLPKGGIVWRAIPSDSNALNNNTEKWMSVSATKEGAMSFAHGRDMKICKIIIGDENVQGLPICGTDNVLDDEHEILIRPGFTSQMIGKNEFKLTIKV